jgi:hypothetical protein
MRARSLTSFFYTLRIILYSIICHLNASQQLYDINGGYFFKILEHDLREPAGPHERVLGLPLKHNQKGAHRKSNAH